MTRVLVLAAHPDDAELAIGGSIARWTDSGIDVAVAVFCASETSREMTVRRVTAAQESAAVLGHRLLWLADPALRQVELAAEFEVVELIDKTVAAESPDVVIGHWPGDSHGDHVRMARATLASSRRWPAAALLQFGPNEFRVPTHQNFQPNLFLPMGAQADRKDQALRAYSYEGRGFRDLDFEGGRIRSSALGSTCGVSAAEGLLLVRCVGETAAVNVLARLLGITAPENDR